MTGQHGLAGINRMLKSNDKLLKSNDKLEQGMAKLEQGMCKGCVKANAVCMTGLYGFGWN